MDPVAVVSGVEVVMEVAGGSRVEAMPQGAVALSRGVDRLSWWELVATSAAAAVVPDVSIC